MYGYGYYPGFYFDPTYILILIGAILSMWASSRVKSTFARYDRVRNIRGITGAQAAETILHQAGIYNVSVQRIQGRRLLNYRLKSILFIGLFTTPSRRKGIILHYNLVLLKEQARPSACYW